MMGVAPLSLSSLCAVTGRGWIMAVVRAYFDNSGKPEDPNVDWVALAGYLAPEDSWTEFDKAWPEALGDKPYLHMGELIHSKGPFKGMSREDKELLLNRVATALMKLGDKFKMYGVACAAHKHAHAAAQQKNPKILSIAEACGEICFWHIFERFGTDEDLAVQVFYDRGEQQFYRKILADWENKKKQTRDKVLSKLKVKPAPVSDSKDFPAMQAADFLAWYTYQAHHAQDARFSIPPMRVVITKFVTLNVAYWEGKPKQGSDDQYYLPPFPPKEKAQNT